MKYLVVLCAVIGFACGSHEGGLRIRFDMDIPSNMGVSFFYDIPRYVSGVAEQGWTKQSRPDNYLPTLELYCPEDFTFCVLYDDTGYVAGIQIAFNEEKYTGSIFEWKSQGFTEWKPTSNGQRYWTTQQYFVDERYLAMNENERIASRSQQKTLQTDGVWVKSNNNGELLKISTTKEGIDNSDFTLQACIPWMGTHYYYNMSATTECNSNGIMPWFLLVNNGELIGTGLMTFGKMAIEEGKRDWFERPETAAVQVIVPHAPACLYQLADNPGVITMHIYYIDDPTVMMCT